MAEDVAIDVSGLLVITRLHLGNHLCKNIQMSAAYGMTSKYRAHFNY